jgi:GR25 family glycosyltransferase involved in LPS biosynthesis
MMNTETSANYWEYFDKFYCISLDERADRREDAKIQFAKIGLLDKIEFVIVKKHTHNNEQGIFESHMSCIKKGILAGANNMVVFEDDILFERFSPTVLKNCVDFLSTNPHWNVLFFGCLVSSSKKTDNKSVLKVKYRSLAHAYALNHNFAKSLIKIHWQGKAFDAILQNLTDTFYLSYPSFAFQGNSRSDNSRFARLDKFRRLCGGLKRIQKWNEFYHRHKIIVIALHIIMILLCLKWVF